jgi:L-aspartate oxidase
MMTHYDYIVIGSGIAGLNVALLALEHGSVLVLTKGRIDDCNTRYAQGGVAAAIGPGDSADLHLRDTLAAGAGLCDREAVAVLTSEGPARVADLIQRGVPFDTSHGQISLGREGAHSLPRILHAGGDATGEHIELTLSGLVRESGIDVCEFTLATGLLVEDGRVLGVETLEVNSGKRDAFTGSRIVVASGGAGQLYRYTTNPQVATGDGVALAYRAGAQLMDMEFYQFHPTALRLAGVPSFLLSEAMRGEGAVLRDVNGRAFMSEYHPLADLAPRDVVARAIATEMEQSGQESVSLDISHLPAESVKSRFPSIFNFCQSVGLDITKEPVPVAPSAHYMMGGVKTDVWGRTNIENLYACGEVACTAVHGANRLASNSLLDTLVFAKRVVDTSASPQKPWPTPALDGNLFATLVPRQGVCGSIPALSREALQDQMWRNLGIQRRGSPMLLAARILNVWDKMMAQPTDGPSHELCNMVLLGRLIAESALLRQESRGSHYRSDFPDTASEWEKHIVLSQAD